MLDFRMEWLPEAAPGIRVLKLAGPFTLNAVFEFQAAIRDRPAGMTIIDLADVPYMDSAALGSLLSLHVSCQRDHREYTLVSVPNRLKTLFNVAGVAGVLVMADSVEAAKAASTGK